jgi:uncharacterized protein (DUF3084 family)
MKKLLAVFLRFFGKKKFVDLDGDGKVESLRNEISGVFSQFEKMNTKLGKVNKELQTVIEDEELAREVEEDTLKKIIEAAEAKLRQSDKVIEKAQAEIKANEKLQEKVKEFIV